MYEIRKSIGGYSIDKKEGNTWIFIAKFSSKKACQEFINSKKPQSVNQINEQITLF
jgi:hypothetical protein